MQDLWISILLFVDNVQKLNIPLYNCVNYVYKSVDKITLK